MPFPRVRCGWTCLRRLGGWIFWLSLLGLLASLGLAGWAYWLKQKLADHLDLALPADGYLLPGTLTLACLLAVPSHLLGISLWPALVRDFASRRNFARSAGKSLNRLLLLHSVLSCLSGCLAAGACAGGAYYWDQTRRRLGQGLRRAIRRYHDYASVKARLDRLQVELACCGSESFVDWFFVPWVRSGLAKSAEPDDPGEDEDREYYYGTTELSQNHRVQEQLAKGGERQSMYLASVDVPFSCCLAQVLQTCEHRNLFALTSAARLSIASVGCREKLLDQANEAGLEVFVCLVLLAVYQLILSVLSRLLQTARLSAARPDASGASRRFAGWIFGAEPQNTRPSPRRLKQEKERLVSEYNGKHRRPKSKQLRESEDEEKDDDEEEEEEEEDDGGDDEDSDYAANLKDNRAANKQQPEKRADSPNDASSSSLSPPPPTARRASSKAPTQAVALDAESCPLHDRCPVHVPVRASCPVHGNVNFRR